MSLHTEYAELDELGGGRFRQSIHLKPIAYRKDGGLHRITSQLGATGDAAFPVGVDELCQFRIDPRIAGKSPLVHFGKGQSMVRFALSGANNVAGAVAGNSVKFTNAWNNADLEYIIGGHRLYEYIRLRANHPRTFTFIIQEHVGFDPLTLQFGNDFRILQPTLEPPMGSDKMALPLSWIVAQSGGKWALSCTLPVGDWTGWMIDPTLTLQPSAADGIDTFTASWAADTNYAASIAIYLHSNAITTNCRGLVKFDLSGIPVGATITSAMLTLTPYAGNVGGTTLQVARILPANNAWTESGATWNYAVSAATRWAGDVGNNGGADAGCSVVGTDYSSTFMHEEPILDPTTPLVMELLLSEFNTLLTANHGIVLRNYHPTNANRDYTIASSDHATALWHPKLVVDYTPPGGGGIFQSGIHHSAIHGGTIVR